MTKNLDKNLAEVLEEMISRPEKHFKKEGRPAAFIEAFKRMDMMLISALGPCVHELLADPRLSQDEKQELIKVLDESYKVILKFAGVQEWELNAFTQRNTTDEKEKDLRLPS